MKKTAQFKSKKEVIRILKKLGFEEDRQRGSHLIFDQPFFTQKEPLFLFISAKILESLF